MWGKLGKYSLKGGYYILTFVVPIVVTLCFFPLWREAPAKMLSGASVLGLVIATTALRRKIKAHINATAPFMLFAVALGICAAIRAIVDDLVIVLLVSLISSVIGEALRLVHDAICEGTETKKTE